MFNFLLEAFTFFINDVFEKSNEQIFLTETGKLTKKIQPKCLIFSRDRLKWEPSDSYHNALAS